jgi:predicted ATPase
VGSNDIIYALVEQTMYKPDNLKNNKVARSLFPPTIECLAFFVVVVRVSSHTPPLYLRFHRFKPL